MLRVVLFLIFFWIHQILIIPFLLTGWVLYFLGFKRAGRGIAIWIRVGWSKFVLKLAGAKVELLQRGTLPDGPALYASNHQGAFDIPLQIAYIDRPIVFIAKKELRRVPLIGDWMALSYSHFIDRENKRASLQTIRACIADLQAEESIIIYPEGTRSNSATMAPFKKGSLNIAVKAGVPIVPVAIIDSFKLKPVDKMVIRPSRIRMVICEPIPTKDLSKEEKDVLTETVQAAIQRELDLGIDG